MRLSPVFESSVTWGFCLSKFHFIPVVLHSFCEMSVSFCSRFIVEEFAWLLIPSKKKKKRKLEPGRKFGVVGYLVSCFISVCIHR